MAGAFDRQRVLEVLEELREIEARLRVVRARVKPEGLQGQGGGGDPGYLFYSIGKLMIMKLRNDWLAIHPGSSLRDFHDAFLSFGTSPLTLVRKAMLGYADDGRLFH